jgi:multisubunit Na+/H+ antiporter MnhF subunit
VNEWLVAATVLVGLLIVCGAVAALADLMSGVVALEIAGVVSTTALLLLAEGTHRQSFVDLALVAAVLSVPGALVFVRLLERRI